MPTSLRESASCFGPTKPDDDESTFQGARQCENGRQRGSSEIAGRAEGSHPFLLDLMEDSVYSGNTNWIVARPAGTPRRVSL
jgi:hypothetical protein